MSKFVNRNKKSYAKDYVLKSIKSDKLINQHISASLTYYADKDISTQFWSSQYKEFEIIIINDVKKIKSGFYIVDKEYAKFQESSFIQRKKRQSKLKTPHSFFNKDKKIDKYFIEYIKDNTILYYDLNDYIKEFKTIKAQINTDFQQHSKTAHSVNGHWRNQPYGNRRSPKYKRIWIEEFDKGAA